MGEFVLDGISNSEMLTLLNYVKTLMSQESFTVSQTGAQLESDFDFIAELKDYYYEPVGVLIDTTSNTPAVQRIDSAGNKFYPSENYFNLHPLWNMWRCFRDRTTGVISYGADRNGTGYATDGSNGDVLVDVPIGKSSRGMDGDFIKIMVAPSWNTDYSYDPFVYTRGGVAHSKVYGAAYEAGLRDFASSPKLQSISGVQPVTGDGAFRYVAFTSGGTATPTPGVTITGGTSGATGTVISYHKTSGDWSTGDAAGTVYMKQVSKAFNSTGEELYVGGVDIMTISGDATKMTLPLATAETYGNNVGTGFGNMNIHLWNWLCTLMLIEYGSFNIQNVAARGVVDTTGTSSYLGALTGADSVDSNLMPNGTGVGSGASGHTPFTWRGYENLFGNTNTLIMGINTSDVGENAHIINRAGVSSATIEAILSSGNYETTAGMNNTTDGYINTVLTDDVALGCFLPVVVGSTETTTAGSAYRYCDYFTHGASANNVLNVGGSWSKGSWAGPWYKSFALTSGGDSITTGARLEYYPQ